MEYKSNMDERKLVSFFIKPDKKIPNAVSRKNENSTT